MIRRTRRPDGTGPYRLADFQPGVRASFERNASDWRSDRGFVDSVEILVMNDSTARVAALSSGQVHFVNTLEPHTVSLLGRARNVEVIRTAGKGFYSFLMHCDAVPFDNNDLRLALRAPDAAFALFHLLSVQRRMERHALPA